MNRLARTLILSALIFAVTSCISFNTTGINALSKDQRALITRPLMPLEQLTPGDSIYIVNDSAVSAFLADKEYAIVHSFLTWCKGEHCINPAIAHRNLQDTDLPFLMIANDLESYIGYHAPYPFISIDFDYYGTKNYSTGIERIVPRARMRRQLVASLLAVPLRQVRGQRRNPSGTDAYIPLHRPSASPISHPHTHPIQFISQRLKNLR